MTTEEKALELCQLFGRATMFSHDNNGKTLTIETSKKMAIICVDEILFDDMYGMDEENFDKRIEYWEQVKQEIEKL